MFYSFFLTIVIVINFILLDWRRKKTRDKRSSDFLDRTKKKILEDRHGEDAVVTQSQFFLYTLKGKPLWSWSGN